MHKAFPLPVMEFPLPGEVPTASEESSHCQKKREATAVKIALLLKSRRNYTVSDGTGKKKGRTVTVIADDMQKRKNDVKVRTTLLLSLPDEHQLRFSKYKTAQELWTAILKTFGGIEATKKTKKNLLKQQSDLDTMSLDDLYNHLKVYESKVQKKSEPNSYNMAFIFSAKHSRGNEEVNTTSVSTASTNVPIASANIGVASISQDTACPYIASQSSGSQIKFEDINQIDKDDMEEMYIKWNMALLSMKANRAPRIQDKGRRDNFKKWSKVEEHAPKALMAIDGMGWDWSYMVNDEENHALVADKEAPTEFSLMAKTSAKRLAQVESRLAEYRDQEIKYYKKIRGLELEVEFKTNSLECLTKELETLKKEKKGLDKNKEGLGYSNVPPPPAQIYSSPKKDMSWTGLPKFKDDTVTDYSRPAPTIESSPNDAQNINPSVTETEASPSTISPKSFIKFVKANDSPTKSKTDKVKTAKKPLVKYTEQYRKPTKKPNVRGNQRNWKNLKSHQLGPNFVMEKKACFNCGDFNHLAHDCRKRDNIDDKGYWDSGCSRYMTGNISYLSDYESFGGGYVSFGQGGCKITGKGTIKTGKLEFENVYFVKDLKYNLFSMSQICDNKNSVLFTDLECIVLGQNFKLSYDDNVLLKTPRQHNMYSIDLNNILPHKDLTCLVAKASADECMLYHRRLGHLNFKTMNKLVRHNLVRGLPTKCFENDHTCTACLKEKQHKASCKSKLVNSVSKPLHTLHMDLLGPTSDETSGILRKFITEIDNLKDLKVKIIRCDNGEEFRNKEMNDFCSHKGIKREFSNARTPQQKGVAKRRNKTLIEAARTMLADAKLPVTFWAKAVNTAWYLIREPGRVEENLHVEFLENKAIEKGAGPNWLFDIDSLTKSMNYVLVDAGTNSTNLSGTKDAASQEVKKDVSSLRYIALPNWVHNALLESSSTDQLETLKVETPISTVSSPVSTSCFIDSQEPSSDTRLISKRVAKQVETPSLDNILTLTNRFEDILEVTTNSDESNGVEADVRNMERTITTSPTPTLRIHKDHPKSQIIGPVDTLIQTRTKSKEVDRPKGVRPIGTKWVLKNKKDERGIVIRNKTRLVAQGNTQEEGIDYDEVFAPLARIEAIKLFLDYASLMGFTVYQMDVKSAFLYGTIDEEVYVMQPLGFQDPEFLARVYKVKKAMYGLHQAPRAWLSMPCEALSREISSSILRLSENNVDFHPIVDFIEASPLRYALTFKPTVYVSHIRQFWSTARIETTEEGTKILTTVDGILRTVTESSLRQYTKSARIAQYLAFPPVADEHASPLRDGSQGEACPTDSGFGADQDRANIAKTSTLPHDLAPRVTSPAADEGSMQQILDELMALCTSLQRQHSEMVSKFEAQELEINMLKVRVKLLEDREGGGAARSGDDALIKGRNLDEGEAAAERVSDYTEEMATVLTSMDATTVLASRVAEVPIGSGSIPTAGSPATEVPTGSDVVPTAESKTPKKKKVQEQIDAQVTRELEEQMAREDQRMSEQVARDAEVARIHAKEKLQMMINSLDRSNETVLKYLQEYEQFAED
nr:hypothetical protein [Tanacetum cinerariifolium]